MKWIKVLILVVIWVTLTGLLTEWFINRPTDGWIQTLVSVSIILYSGLIFRSIYNLVTFKNK